MNGPSTRRGGGLGGRRGDLAPAEESLVPVRKKVGMLFQSGALFDSMTVFENVAFALREHTSWSGGTPPARRGGPRFRELGRDVNASFPRRCRRHEEGRSRSRGRSRSPKCSLRRAHDRPRPRHVHDDQPPHRDLNRGSTRRPSSSRTTSSRLCSWPDRITFLKNARFRVHGHARRGDGRRECRSCGNSLSARRSLARCAGAIRHMVRADVRTKTRVGSSSRVLHPLAGLSCSSAARKASS